jgi:hypothetical protein
MSCRWSSSWTHWWPKKETDCRNKCFNFGLISLNTGEFYFETTWQSIFHCLLNRQQRTDSGGSQLVRRHPTHSSVQPQRAVVCQLHQWWTSCVALRLTQWPSIERGPTQISQESKFENGNKSCITILPVEFNNWNVFCRIVKWWSSIIQSLIRKRNYPSNEFWKCFAFESTYYVLHEMQIIDLF